MITYGFTKKLEASLIDTIDLLKTELQKEGFGVITTIDLHQKFKEKLGIDHKKYIIIGVCDPISAHQAISVERNIGLMLPCNIIVYEKENRIVLSVIRPTVAMGMINNDDLIDIATNVEEKLKRVFDGISD